MRPDIQSQFESRCCQRFGSSKRRWTGFVEFDRSGISRQNAKEREVAGKYRKAESFQASKTGWITASKRSAHGPEDLFKWRQSCHLVRSNVKKIAVKANYEAQTIMEGTSPLAFGYGSKV